MALGGGIIKTTAFPGTYINFVSTAKTRPAGVGTRGVVAVCYKLPKATETNVVECTAAEFYSSNQVLGAAYGDESMWAFREIFKHATKVVVYNLANEGATLAAGLTALESYEFNIIVTDSTETADVTAVITKVKSWRNEIGKKVQAVVYNHSVEGDLNNVGVINLASKPIIAGDSDVYTEASLVYWLAGAMAGCAVNKSCTNMMYDGELDIDVAYSQSDLQAFIDAGKVAFHLVYGDVRILEDINSLITPNETENEDFKYNQTIRVIDQIANDIAYLFNTKYLGRIQNNASGRVSLWSDIVSHHKELETMGAIENFSSENVVVTAGDSIKSIIVEDAITITGTMSQLFMTVVLE